MSHIEKVLLLLGVLIPLCWALDPCFDINNPTYGNIGNCIPRVSCSSGVTVENACPSYSTDHVCCFDENFPGHEVRGAWVATVANIDWPLRPTDGVATQKALLINTVDNLRNAGINTIYFQVRPHGDALYASPIEPWSQYLTNKQGQAPDPLWDPLEYIINYAHSMDIEVHAWINPYRANMAATTVGLSPQHMAIQFPEYAYLYGTFVWMDPGAEVVQNRTYDVSIDLVTRYDLDGLHMDDYFYPYPVAGQEFPDSATYAKYIENGGNMNLADWRRDNVNRLVERTNAGVHRVKPWIKFSISPFGLYRAGEPEGMPRPIAGFDQYSQLYSDPKLWLQQGWVDVLQPQLYWQISAPNQSYPMLLDWWVAQNTLERHVFAGNGLYRILEGWPLSEFPAQMKISRETQYRSRGSWGNVHFSAKYIRDNHDGALDYFKTLIYPYPTLQPALPWLAEGQPLPGSVKITKTTNNSISWGNSDPILHKFVVYKQIEGMWQVFKILPKNHATTDLESGGYFALSVIDRFGRESEKTSIIV